MPGKKISGGCPCQGGGKRGKTARKKGGSITNKTMPSLRTRRKDFGALRRLFGF